MVRRSRKLAAIGAAVVVMAGIAVWVGSRRAAPPRATFAPGQAVIEDSEMSPKAFAERRRQMVEAHRAGTGTGADGK